MERLQTGQDRSSTSKVRRLNTVPAGQRYAMVMPSYFSSLSRFNAKKPSPYHHDMQGKTILAFSRIVLLDHLIRQDEERRGERDPEGVGRLQAEHQLELGGLLHRRVR